MYTFNPFNIIPFPTQIPGTNNYVILNTITPFVAVSKNQDYYNALSSHDLGSCLMSPHQSVLGRFPFELETFLFASYQLSYKTSIVTEYCVISVLQAKLPPLFVFNQ